MPRSFSPRPAGRTRRRRPGERGGQPCGKLAFRTELLPARLEVQSLLRASVRGPFADVPRIRPLEGRHIGIEVTLPRNRWVSTLLWEGLATKDQSGPILYDGDERFDGSVLAFAGTQISAMDNYYNNYYYHSWAHYGMGMGNPLLPGPIYNRDGKPVVP